MPTPPKDLVERLFRAQGRRLRSYFTRRIRNPADAGDLVQEVYLRMLRVQDADLIRNPELYLFTVAANLLREQAVLQRRLASAVDIDEEAIQAQLGELPTSEDDVDLETRKARLRVVLRQLPDKCRATVALRFRFGLTYKEVGEELDISPDMVKKYLKQALLHCRRRMAEMK